MMWPFRKRQPPALSLAVDDPTPDEWETDALAVANGVTRLQAELDMAEQEKRKLLQRNTALREQLDAMAAENARLRLRLVEMSGGGK